MTLFASLSLGCALPPLAALATLSNLPAASAGAGILRNLLGTLPPRAGCLFSQYWLSASTVGACRNNRYAITCWSTVGRRTLRLPGRRLTFLQLIITALDVAAAATVLYLLLPEAPPFGAFLLVYLLALAAGVLSHVPGGVGVFEAICWPLSPTNSVPRHWPPPCCCIA
jgi:phosphatidylglycerol lysyltransferase